MSPGTYVLLQVTDTGTGIDPGIRNHIFDAFFTTKPQGTGMGLAISRAIVQAHGGALSAAANRPSGATFHFTLPDSIPDTAKLQTTDRGREIPVHDDGHITQSVVNSSL